jgi:hypothetical protein
MTTDLPYPFSRDDEAPYYLVALGNGEYVRVVLAGDYTAVLERLYEALIRLEMARGN